MKKITLWLIGALFVQIGWAQTWQSKFVSINENQQLEYKSDAEGNIIPDFSRVGYASGEKPIPEVQVVEIVEPVAGDNLKNIQNAIDKVASRSLDANGFRGAILLKKGIYNVNGSLLIQKSGIVIRGEGPADNGTIIRETATKQIDLILIKGSGTLQKNEATKVKISENYVPVGRNYIELTATSSFQVGDSVLLHRPATDNWIQDLKMDQIEERDGTIQWNASGYHLYFERIISKVDGNKVYLDNPVVMQMDQNYGGGYLIKYHFNGRIKNCGIENLRMESTYQSATDENHGWNAINFSKVDQAWVQNVVSKYFGYSCVSIDSNSRNISVLNSQCLEAKSQITGGRRYSFDCNGQLNLFKNCYTTEGRHDYVTGSKVLGPNVFTQCKARNTHADIGPHHRWSCGTLYDLIDTDGEINVQDRGNWGSGHGWAGVTQVVWNCRSSRTAVQSPWVSGKNYCIGMIGGKYSGRLAGRPDGEWEGINQQGLQPESLYETQLKNRMLSNGISQNMPSGKLQVYPNPSKGQIYISHKETALYFNFYSLIGNKIKSGIISESPFCLNIKNVVDGIYLLECFSGNKKYTQKIILNRSL